MASRPSIYRESALRRLSSPEQLDQLMRVVSPRGWMALAAAAVLVILALAWSVLGTVPTAVKGRGVIVRAGGTNNIPALESGQVDALLVNVGDHVSKGQAVARLRPLAGSAAQSAAEDTVISTFDGRVLEVLVDPANVVSPGMPILNIEQDGEPLEAVVYVPVDVGKQVRPGMKATVSPTSFNRQEYGDVLAQVQSVAPFPSTQTGMMRLLENEGLVNQFLQAAGGTPLEIHLALIGDASTPSGYRWSSSRGPDAQLSSGTLAGVEITLAEQRPLSLILPVGR